MHAAVCAPQACVDFSSCRHFVVAAAVAVRVIENMLEGINCKITKAEEQMSNPGDRILEISGTKHNTEKRMKRIHSQETSETTCTKIQIK